MIRNLRYLFILFALLSFFSCVSNDVITDETPFVMTSAPIGKTYAFDGDFALTFESADSVSYRSLSALPTYSPHLCAKGHYTFDNGIVVVENPILDEWYWVEGQDTLPPCYLRLNGRFTALDVLEASFAFAMPGKIISGIGFLKIAKFSPFADNNYYIASFYTDKALDDNNDGKASTNLYEELTTGKQPMYNFKTPEAYSPAISDGNGHIQASFCFPVQSWNVETSVGSNIIHSISLFCSFTEIDNGTQISLDSGETDPRIRVVGMERTMQDVFRIDLQMKLYDFKTKQWVETEAWAFFYTVYDWLPEVAG